MAAGAKGIVLPPTHTHTHRSHYALGVAQSWQFVGAAERLIEDNLALEASRRQQEEMARKERAAVQAARAELRTGAGGDAGRAKVGERLLYAGKRAPYVFGPELAHGSAQRLRTFDGPDAALVPASSHAAQPAGEAQPGGGEGAEAEDAGQAEALAPRAWRTGPYCLSPLPLRPSPHCPL